MDKKGTHNVNFITKTGQNDYAVNAREWSSAPKNCTLATARGAVARHATYILHDVNAEVICYRQAVFNP